MNSTESAATKQPQKRIVQVQPLFFSDSVEEAIRLIVGPGNVTELRALEATAIGDRRPATYFGYFDDPAKLAQALKVIKSAKGIYFVPNRVDSALMARAENRIRKAGKGDTTSDGDIIGRRWLLIDLDAQRASGISASEAEHEAAIEKARGICTEMRSRGWPDPFVVDSCNGAHLLYRIDLPADDAGLVKQCLAALAQWFDDEAVKVDQTVHNPAHIWRLPGTLACKGDNTVDRPHRMARILSKPDKPCIVPAGLLKALADEEVAVAAVVAPQDRAARNGRFSIDDFAAKHLDCSRGPEPYEDGRIWRLDVCPFNSSHTNGEAAIIERQDGTLGFKCQHHGCASRSWKDVRAKYEPRTNVRARNPCEPVLLRMSDVTPEPIRWLWEGKFALGKLSMIVGDPGLGKSFLTLDMAARVSTGTPWPDAKETANPMGGVILLSAEDYPEDTLHPRLTTAHADLSKIQVLQCVRQQGADSEETKDRLFNLECDIKMLEEAILRVDKTRLIIVDPITAYTGSTDSHKNAEVRGLLAPLADLAARTGVAIVCVSHLNKAANMSAVYRTMGSLAFTAAARAVWCVARDPNDTTGRRKLFLQIKNNLAANPVGLAFTVEAVNPADDYGPAYIAWDPEPVTVSIDEAMAPPRRDSPKLDEAVEWLMERLESGPREKRLLLEEAKVDGISKKTLRRAFEQLGGTSTSGGYGKSYLWSLSKVAHAISTHAEMGNLGELAQKRKDAPRDTSHEPLDNLGGDVTHITSNDTIRGTSTAATDPDDWGEL